MQRLVQGLLAACLLSSCTGWQIAGSSPQVMDSIPSHIRLTLAGGERVELKRARVEMDSLVGMVDVDSASLSVRIAVPVDSVRRVAVRGRTATTRAVSFAGGVAVLTGLVGFLLIVVTR